MLRIGNQSKAVLTEKLIHMELQQRSFILNRFLIKQLEASDLTFYEYQCVFKEMPELGHEERSLSRICYKLGVTAVRLGSRIITREKISSEFMINRDWQLLDPVEKELSTKYYSHRKALETFERRVLEKKLKSLGRTEVERANEGGLIWWRIQPDKSGNGWEVHKGRRIDIAIDSDANLFLEIDTHHRFYTPWTLHQWLEKHPEIPIRYVRNTYKDKNGNYISWKYEKVSDELPEKLLLEKSDMTLANYHRQIGATEDQINHSRVIYVKKTNQSNAKLVPHLSQRLSPSLTMEMLANLAEHTIDQKEKQKIQDIFTDIKKSLNIRLQEAQQIAKYILENVYNIPGTVSGLNVQGYILPSAKLLARNNQPVKKVSEVRYRGCAKISETNFGCLNLYNDTPKYPQEVEKCLRDIAKSSKVKININFYYTQQDFPHGDLDRKMFWQTWSDQGVKTVLVILPWSSPESKQKIRIEALQAGIATQFIVPIPKANEHKAINVTLGLLCKAGWQPVGLEPLKDPEAADLIIGFDTGTNRELYYGASAFAVLADGQSLGWELPDVQRGETFSGHAIWQTVSKLLLKFHQICDRYPQKLLLMRDGLVQEGEFEPTIKALEEKNITVDVLSVRKSGTGRMGRKIQEGEYRDAEMGSVFFMPQEKSFMVVTSKPVSNTIGSARPLRVVHEYGNTPLNVLALQTYHLTQLHPASAYQACRLPWVLHFADKSSKEFQRIGQMSILQNISREKLISV